jgi:hypothetical protein
VTVELDDWIGTVSARMAGEVPRVEFPLQPSSAGGSGTFLALCSDNRRWWVKPANNLQSGKVIVTEHVVGRAGALIGAPVCESCVVEIPSEIEGWEFRPGAALEAGFAHASLAVSDAVEIHDLDYRDRDDNRRRHAGVFALYDWCWGADDQWLVAETDDRRVFSHDHGWYLPEAGPDWSETTLVSRVDQAHIMSRRADGLDAGELTRIADRLESLTRSEVHTVVAAVPGGWPVTNRELEALGFFLERRAPQVAERLRKLSGGQA